MWLLGNFLRLLLILFFSTNYISIVLSRKVAPVPPAAVRAGTLSFNDSDRIPIGVVFDQSSSKIEHAFKIAMVQYTKNTTPEYLNFQVFVDVINTADAFKLSRLVCNQFSRGMVAMLAAVHPDSFEILHSYSNSFHMPFVTPFFPEKVLPSSSGLPEFALSILPDYHKAVLGTLKYYRWRNVIYLYDSDEGMLRLQQLFKSITPGQPPHFRIAFVKKITNAEDVIVYLRQLEKVDRWTNKYVIMDCSEAIAKKTIITHVRDVQLGRRNYHYLFSGLVLDDRWDRDVQEYGTINITGFRMVDTSRKFVQDFFNTWKMDSIAAKGALMYDAAHTVLEAFQRIVKYKPHIIKNLMNKTSNYRFLNCYADDAEVFKYGEEIAEFMKKTQVEGLSGKIRFSSKGVRQNFSLMVVQNNPDGSSKKVGTWHDDKGFLPLQKLEDPDVSGNVHRHKTYSVLSIHEPPYFTASKPKVDFDIDTDNSYNGFCAELAELIAEKLEINVEFRLSADGKYGNSNPGMIGGWDGMVGELVRMEADMVIAPLMVTAEREAVVDFSKPFLSFNRVAPKKQKENVEVFGFLKPLSKETWYLVASSVMLVSIAMYVVSRFSPMEWKVVAVTDAAQSSDDEAPATRALVINEFSFFNSVWYAISSVMQQGSEYVPRSLSGRIVSSVWWFFTLIIICSYTAHMASQLTLTGMEAPILLTHNRLANCPEDMDFKQKKDITIDDELHGNGDSLDGLYIKKPTDYVKSVGNCEMIVTALNPGIMEFAIAFPKGSKLRTGVNHALSAIKEEGEINRLMRKYFHNSVTTKSSEPEGGRELTLENVVGLFYVLLVGTIVSLTSAFLEFCNYHRSDAARANISIRTALSAKSRLQLNEQQEPQEPQNTNRRRRRSDQERPWNGTGTASASYAGIPVPFESSPCQSPMNPAKAVGPRHVMTRQRSRQVMQQVKKTRQAIDHGPRPYFTPTNQVDQEETALHNSLTQV